MTVDEAITLFRKASESQTVDKEDFINDCVVLFLEGLTAEEAIRKTKNKKIGQAYEKRRFVKPIINDDGEDVSDNIYFVDQSTVEHNDGNYLPKEADKLSTAIILTNALRRNNPTTFFYYYRLYNKKGKRYIQKNCIVNESEYRTFKRNKRMIDFHVLLNKAVYVNAKKEIKNFFDYAKRKEKRK
jgi:hypothetical protein